MTAPPDKSPERIASMFDAIAARYDFLNHFLSVGLDRRWRTRAIADLHLPTKARVLDLCTGTADLAIEATTAAQGIRVVGIDFAGVMLHYALEKLRARRLDDVVALVRGDATRIPVRDQWADAATIVEAKGLRQVTDSGAIEAVIGAVLAAHADKVAEYRAGRDKLYSFFIGQVMRATQGKANPALVNELLTKRLAG